MPENIRFRTLHMHDAPQLFAIYSDKEAMRYRGSNPAQTLEDARDIVRNQELKDGNTLTIREGIELSNTKELIGTVMYRFQKDRPQECEIGYSIGKAYWGQGLGHEIVKNIILSLKNNDQIKKIIARSHRKNIASIRMLEKAGFQRIKQTEYPDNYLYIKQVGL